MWEWLGKGENLSGLGSIIGAGGSIYGGIEQAKASNKMIGLQKDQFAFNKLQIEKDDEDKKSREDIMNSVYGTTTKAV